MTETPRALTLRESWPANAWLRRTAALGAAALLDFPVTLFSPLPGAWALLPQGVLTAVCLPATIMAIRGNAALRQERETRDAAEAADAAALRRPAAPDAGPGQCPVCGLDDLDELAADDALLERGPDRARVVSYGRGRAHRDCAEFVPFTPAAQEKSATFQTHSGHAATGRRDLSCPLCIGYLLWGIPAVGLGPAAQQNQLRFLPPAGEPIPTERAERREAADG